MIITRGSSVIRLILISISWRESYLTLAADQTLSQQSLRANVMSAATHTTVINIKKDTKIPVQMQFL